MHRLENIISSNTFLKSHLMVQMQTPLLVLSLTCTLIILGGMLTIMPSYAQNVSTPLNLLPYTHFFGCKKNPNYECENISSGFKSYIFAGNRTKKVTIERTPTYVPGIDDMAVQFQAKNREAITTGDSPAISSYNFSVSFWVKTSSLVEPYSHVVSHVDKNGTAGWYFDMFSDGKADYMRLRLTSTDGNQQSSVDIPIEKDRFTNIIGTFDGSSIKVYKNAKLVGSSKYVGNFWPYPLLPLTFGAASYGYAQLGWSGTIDDVSIYNRTLGTSEISTSFAREENQNKDLIGNWLFDNNLTDSSKYHDDGTMHTLVTSLAFSPDGKLFVVEKNTGNVKVLTKDLADAKLFVHIPDSYVSWEQGLLGFTIDPFYQQNHFVYLYYTVSDATSGNAFNRVVRFTDNDNKGTNEKILIDRIFASNGYHAGGALAFGPDDKLYITVGDATEHPFAEDPSTLIGKILRINRDGSIPSDNPYPNSAIYTIGHRNMFGLAFDNKNGIGIVTENGDYHYDEVNVIQKGGDYGFPILQPANVDPELANNSAIKPVRSYYFTIGPTQGIFNDMTKIPQLSYKFLFGTYTGSMYALALNSTDHKVTEEDVIKFGFYPFEPVIAVAMSPGGEIYFGGYNLYELSIPREAEKSQILYPVKVLMSKDNHVPDINFDEVSQSLRVNFTTGQSDPTSYMRMEIPKNLLENIIQIQVGYKNGSLRYNSIGWEYF